MRIDYKRLRGSSNRIQMLSYRINELRSQMESITAQLNGAKVQTSRKDILAEQIAQLDEWERELAEEKLMLISEQRRASGAFALLPENECMLMNLRYIDALSWREVEKRMNYSRQHLLRLHKTAIQSINKR